MQAIEAKKSVSPMSKLEDSFDGPNLLELTRIEVEKKKCRKANQGGL